MATLTQQDQQQSVNPVDQVNAIVQNQALAQANASLYTDNLTKASGASYGLTGGAWAAQQAMQQASGSADFTKNYATTQQLLLSQQTQADTAKTSAQDKKNALTKMGLGYLSGIGNKVQKGILDERGMEASLQAGVAAGAITQDMYESAFTENQFDGKSMAGLAVENLDTDQAQAVLDRTQKSMEGLESKSWNDMSNAERATFMEYQSGKK